MGVSAVPETKYALSGDVHVAYQVVGSGPLDLVFVLGVSHLDSLWEQPAVSRWLRRLASFSRLIMFDKRGTGMSDRVEGVPTLEERMDDVRAVMDAAGAERAALCGVSEGGAIAALFAATYPERTAALVVIGSGAVGWQPDPDEQALIDQYILEEWGTGGSVNLSAPSVADDERVRSWFGRWERLSASPGSAVALLRMNAEFDIRSALPAISAPTLVIHRTGDLTYPLERGRYLAEHIAGARLVELPGTDHAPFFEDAELILDTIEEFVTGTRPVPEATRVLATVLFTDIVASTEHLDRLGDDRWQRLLEEHHAVVRAELERFGGNEMNTAGDGFFATFDGPTRAVRCAQALHDALTPLGIEVRCGLHTGEVVTDGCNVTGMGVHIGARVGSLADAGAVLVSRTVKDLVVGSGIEFTDRGTHQLKGVPDAWQLYEVVRS